jgi:hypothetical protein
MKITLAIAAITHSSTAEAACIPVYGQCGSLFFVLFSILSFLLSNSLYNLGVSWNCPTCCESGSTCVDQPNNKVLLSMSSWLQVNKIKPFTFDAYKFISIFFISL